MKRHKCIECGVTKETSEFHAMKNKLGHRYKCKDCVNKYTRTRYTPAQPRVSKRLKNGKAQCSECREWKLIVMFYSAKTKRGCQSKCRLCQKAYQKSLNIKNGIKKPKRQYRPCLGYCQKWRWFPIGVHVCYFCSVKQMGVSELVRH